jgi:hypothetical protein
MAPGERRPVALLALAAAALLSAWNPASAPLGAVVGGVTAALCLARRRQRGPLGVPTAVALGLALAATAGSVVVLVRFSGVARGRSDGAIVDEVPAAERKAALDRAAERTRGARDSARKELDAVDRRP